METVPVKEVTYKGRLIEVMLKVIHNKSWYVAAVEAWQTEPHGRSDDAVRDAQEYIDTTPHRYSSTIE